MEAKLRPTILPPPDLQKHPEKAPELIKSLFRARDHSTRFWYSISVEHLVELARFLQKEMEGKFVTRIHEYYPDINYQQYRGLQKLLQYPELQKHCGMGQVTLNKLLRYKPDNDHGDDEETNFFQGLVASILVGEENNDAPRLDPNAHPRKIDRRSFTIIDPQTHQPANDFYPTLCDTNHKAAVYLAEEKDGEMIVLKTSHNPEDMEQEIGAMTSLTTPHPNVMHMIGIVFELTAAKTWVRVGLLTPYLPQPNAVIHVCEHYWKGKGTHHARSLAIGLANGLAHLEDKGIIHGDLHIGNVLMKQEDGVWQPVIFDFDRSNHVNDESVEEGWYAVCPPEILNNAKKPPPRMLPANFDMFGYGVICQQVVRVTTNRRASNWKEVPAKITTFQQHVNGAIDACKTHKDEVLGKVVSQCTNIKRPYKRPTASEVLQILTT